MSTSGSDYKSQVLAAVDIVELVGRTVALKRAGKDFKGLCPFHQEKTPSFTVSPTKRMFYCYGCKEGGNAIDFVMKRDRVEFIDALRSLGEQAGIPMPKYAGGVSKEKANERQMLLDAHSVACAFFEKSLAHPQMGATARAYLEQRGFTAESVQRFQIGFAPDAWDALLKGPVGRKYAPALLALAGLVKPRNTGDGYYDTFRNRLMFPIRDENSRVIAFGGRVMPGSEDLSTGSGQVPAKYLNSPETPLFSKGRSVFGLDLARHRIVETRTAIVVEGYTDVVVSHQYGVNNVVSVLGTAMTEQHVTTLRRFADKIVLLFDADTAGDLAVDRAVSLFLTQPVEIAIASMPADVDPDEYLLEHGAEGFERMLAGATDALSYKWKQLARRFNESGNSLTGQQKAVEEYLKLLSDARGMGPVDTLRWGQALSRVSRLTEIPREDLNRRFGSSSGRAGQARRTSAETAAPTTVPPTRKLLSAQDRAERWILGILLLEPRRWAAVQRVIDVADFKDDRHRQLAEVYWQHQRDEGEPILNEFVGVLREHGTELVQLAFEVIAETEAESNGDYDTMLNGVYEFLDSSSERQNQRKLQAELHRTSEERDKGVKDPLFEIQEKARRPDLRRA